MEYISLFMRSILCCLFLSTTLHKLKNFQQHINVIKSYDLLPNNWILPVGSLGILFEATVTVCMLFGLMIQWAAMLGLFLLLIYTAVIVISILRGRTNQNCGCGGIAGDHQISWWLVLRNALWMVPCTWLIIFQTQSFRLDTLFVSGDFQYDPYALIVVLIAIVFSLIIGSLNELRNLVTKKERQ